jgi:hypothetical protein
MYTDFRACNQIHLNLLSPSQPIHLKCTILPLVPILKPSSFMMSPHENLHATTGPLAAQLF